MRVSNAKSQGGGADKGQKTEIGEVGESGCVTAHILAAAARGEAMHTLYILP